MAQQCNVYDNAPIQLRVYNLFQLRRLDLCLVVIDAKNAFFDEDDPQGHKLNRPQPAGNRMAALMAPRLAPGTSRLGVMQTQDTRSAGVCTIADGR